MQPAKPKGRLYIARAASRSRSSGLNGLCVPVTLRAMQKKYASGRPDQKDLNENLAATQGLAHMITECSRLFEVQQPSVVLSSSLGQSHVQPLSFVKLDPSRNGRPVAQFVRGGHPTGAHL